MAFFSVIIVAVALVVAFETDTVEVGELAGGDKTEFLVTTFMELLTLAVIPTALRLLKFRPVSKDIEVNGDFALRRWEMVRITMLGVPLVVDTLLYYMYMAAPFGYMAIILLISMVFAYPVGDSAEGRKEDEEA